MPSSTHTAPIAMDGKDEGTVVPPRAPGMRRRASLALPKIDLGFRRALEECNDTSDDDDDVDSNFRKDKATRQRLAEEIVEDDEKFRAFQLQLRQKRVMTHRCLQECISGVMKDTVKGQDGDDNNDSKSSKTHRRCPSSEDSFVWRKNRSGTPDASLETDGGDTKLLHNMRRRRNSCQGRLMGLGTTENQSFARRSQSSVALAREEAAQAVSAAVHNAFSAVSCWVQRSGTTPEEQYPTPEKRKSDPECAVPKRRLSLRPTFRRDQSDDAPNSSRRNSSVGSRRCSLGTLGISEGAIERVMQWDEDSLSDDSILNSCDYQL